MSKSIDITDTQKGEVKEVVKEKFVKHLKEQRRHYIALAKSCERMYRALEGKEEVGYNVEYQEDESTDVA